MPTPEPASRWPNWREDDFILKDYRFANGEVLPELKLHYRTMGVAQRDASGKIVNGVLLLQGNTGTRASHSKHGSILSLCRMQSAAAAPASRRTGCAGTFRITAIATWSIPATG